MPPQDELLTSPQVSHMLGISLSTVRRRAESGELPAAHKLPGPNGAFLFSRAAVEKYQRELAARADEQDEPAAATS